ncbi:hypothetical protein [Geodermatophilus sp. SYSU D00700]
MGLLVLGLALGGLLGAGITTLAGDDTAGDDTAGTVAAPTATADVPGQDSSPGPEGQVSISVACLRAVEAAERAYVAIEDLGSALLALDAGRLDAVVHELQPLRDQLERDLAACRVDIPRGESATDPTRLPSTPPAPSAPPEPSSAGASPTG